MKVDNIINQPLVFVDVETTGISALKSRVIEIAALRFENGKISHTFTSFINPETPIPYNITRITGIHDGDVASAPTFIEISTELEKILDGAIFVAHNVRFDYSFLHHEFKRIGTYFRPKMFCTVKLSRALYPEMPRHRLADLIAYHDFNFTHRHRAYDDAHVLTQFWQKLLGDHSQKAIAEAIGRQFRRPSIPRYIDTASVASLPATAGVYIFRDEQNVPLYIGKSINIKKRVLSHFTRDTAEAKEFKISQNIRTIDFEETAGELAALLRESQLIKQHMPIYNRRLRRVNKLIVLRTETDQNRYQHVKKQELTPAELRDTESIIGIYERRGRANQALEFAVTTFDLCPKLCGLETGKGACFRYQLGKCRGACIEKEPARSYNARLAIAFQNKGIQAWPYDGPIIIEERYQSIRRQQYIVDQWIIHGIITIQQNADPIYNSYGVTFDLDAYTILRSFLLTKPERLIVQQYRGEFDEMI